MNVQTLSQQHFLYSKSKLDHMKYQSLNYNNYKQTKLHDLVRMSISSWGTFTKCFLKDNYFLNMNGKHTTTMVLISVEQQT